MQPTFFSAAACIECISSFLQYSNGLHPSEELVILILSPSTMKNHHVAFFFSCHSFGHMKQIWGTENKNLTQQQQMSGRDA